MTSPRVVIKFSHLPSFNDILAVSRYKFGTSKFIRDWLLIGERHACEFAKSVGCPTEQWTEMVSAGKDKDGNKKQKPVTRERLVEVLLQDPLRLEFHVWRADSRVYDVHNVFLKPVIDGLRAAQLFRDDSVDQIKQVLLKYHGIDRDLAPSKAERQSRKDEINKARLTGKRIKRAPGRARYLLEFHELPEELPEAPLFALSEGPFALSGLTPEE